ncbi:hypothetical protein Tco_0594048 [Tanacetum coccineum]
MVHKPFMVLAHQTTIGVTITTVAIAGNNNRGHDNGRQFDWASTQNTVYNTCNRCGIGQIPSQCLNRDPSTIRTRPSANFANTCAQSSSNASTNWHSDTGANSHVTPDLEAMDNSEAYYGDDALHVGNGHSFSGFPVNGEPLMCDDEETKILSNKYLGKYDENRERPMRMKRKWLEDNFEKVPSDATEETLSFYVQAYILHHIGTFILLDANNSSHYPVYWLCFLKDLNPGALHGVAWGAAAYCMLTYRFPKETTSLVGPWWLYEDIIVKSYEDYPSYRSQRIFFTRAVTFNFNNLAYHEPVKGYLQLLTQKPNEMGDRDLLKPVSSKGRKIRKLCERYAKFIKIWEDRHEETWCMDNNDSSFAIPITRDPKEEIILDQEEEPISDQEGDGGSHEDSIHFNSDREGDDRYDASQYSPKSADEMTHFVGDDRYDSSQSAPTSADEDSR